MLHLEPTPASAWRARSFVHQRLRDWGCDHLDEVTTLLTSEVVSNAIIHARQGLSLRVGLSGQVVRVEVRDGDHTLPRRQVLSPEAAGGRGLLLVDALADRWGSSPEGSGKVVWFEVEAGSTPLPC